MKALRPLAGALILLIAVTGCNMGKKCDDDHMSKDKKKNTQQSWQDAQQDAQRQGQRHQDRIQQHQGRSGYGN